MIRVRPRGRPRRSSAEGARARQGAAPLRSPANPGAPFTFQAYKHDDVKRALNEASTSSARTARALRGDAAARCRALPAEERRASRETARAGAATTGLPRAGETCSRPAPTATGSGRRRFRTGRADARQGEPVPDLRRRRSARDRRATRRTKDGCCSTRTSTTPERTSSSRPMGSSAGSPARDGASIQVYALLRRGLVSPHGLEQEVRTQISIARGLASQARDATGRRRPRAAARGGARPRSQPFIEPTHEYSAMARS